MSDDRSGHGDGAPVEPAGPPPPPPPGMPPQPQVVYVQQPPAASNGLATAALVVGIIGVVLFFTVWLGVILGVLAVVFGAVGRSRASRGAPNKGLATAGLVLGVVSILASILFLVAVVQVSRGAGGIFDHIQYCLDHPNDRDC